MINKIKQACQQISNETVNLVEFLNSISFMTNGSVIVYDYTEKTIVYAHLSGAINYIPQYPDNPNVDLQLYLGEEGMKEIEKTCYYKDDFMKRLSDDEKQKIDPMTRNDAEAVPDPRLRREKAALLKGFCSEPGKDVRRACV